MLPYPSYPLNQNQTAVEIAEPPISRELQRLSKSINELNELTSIIESRMSIVMRQPEPQPAVNRADQPAEPASPILSLLRDRNAEIDMIIRKCSAILRRLEI